MDTLIDQDVAHYASRTVSPSSVNNFHVVTWTHYAVRINEHHEWNSLGLCIFIDIQTSKTLVQIDIKKIMRMDFYNEEWTHTVRK